MNNSMESTIYTVNGQEFELKHYGVKGMKWGVRKAQEQYAKLDRLKGAYKKAKKNRGKVTTRTERKAAKESYKQAKQAYKLHKKEVRKHTTFSQKMGHGVQKTKKLMINIGDKSVQAYTKTRDSGKAWVDEWVRG